MKVVKKPWGQEIWFAVTDRYAGKIILFKKGYKSSLQYHQTKHETLYVDEGLLKLTLGHENRDLVTRDFRRGDAVVIPPKTMHRLEAIEDSRIIEVSTPELDDVVRVEDDFGRRTKIPSRRGARRART